MSQRKPNKKNWYSLGLAVLLCMALLVITTGTTQARYRAERERDIYFRARVPDQIHLGTVSVVTDENETEDETVSTKEVFTPNSQLIWETDARTAQLTFAVANGVSEQDYSARDQKVRLCMIGSLGVWTGTQPPSLYLVLPLEEGEQETVITATVSPIMEGTALYLEYGDGWIYTFLDAEGEELYWELPGGELSFVTLQVAVEEELSEKVNLLKPLVTAEVIQD